MSAEILEFTGDTTLDLEPNKILEGAVDKLEEALIIGWTLEGDFYLAATSSKIGNILLLLELAKKRLL